MFNSYFCGIPEELLMKKGKSKELVNYHLNIRNNSKSMFLYPISEDEAVKVAKCL
jgi:hypothetical protein